MKEHKYRAWDKEFKMMSEPMELFKNGQSFFFFPGIGTRCPNHESLIVMEFTGLHDSKRTKEYPEGQEIWEGDVVRRIIRDGDSTSGATFTVEWVSCTARFAVISIDTGKYGDAEWTIDPNFLEVIGTIHDKEVSNEKN